MGTFQLRDGSWRRGQPRPAAPHPVPTHAEVVKRSGPGVYRDVASSASMRSSWLYLATRSVRDGGAGLDLPGVGRHGDVGDGRVLGLAGAVGDHRRVARPLRHARWRRSVSVRVPIWFTLTRMVLATPCSMPLAEPLGVGDEQVVAHQLHPVADALRSASAQPSQSSSARPSSMETIGYLSHQLFVEGRSSRRRSERLAFAGEVVLAVLETTPWRRRPRPRHTSSPGL